MAVFLPVAIMWLSEMASLYTTCTVRSYLRQRRRHRSANDCVRQCHWQWTEAIRVLPYQCHITSEVLWESGTKLK